VTFVQGAAGRGPVRDDSERPRRCSRGRPRLRRASGSPSDAQRALQHPSAALPRLPLDGEQATYGSLDGLATEISRPVRIPMST
jgi:hypothetical protein